MDCCKAVSLAARYEGDIWNDFWDRAGIVDFEPLPLGFVVTVTGKGSECNGGAVITNEEQKIKTGRDYPACNAKFAMLDPAYTMTAPQRQTVSGGFDILSHIMETYFRGVDEKCNPQSAGGDKKSEGLYCPEQPYVGGDYGGKPYHQAGQAV